MNRARAPGGDPLDRGSRIAAPTVCDCELCVCESWWSAVYHVYCTMLPCGCAGRATALDAANTHCKVEPAVT